MTDDERRDLFRACVQAGAIVEAIQAGRGFPVAADAIAGAWRVPASSIPEGEEADAAMEYLDYQIKGFPRPAWLP
jgi:hypothetical protein